MAIRRRNGQWRPGHSGNKGRSTKADRRWRTALRMELKAGEGNGRGLRDIARVVIDLALAGDMRAIKEIGDRLDGRPAQQVQLTGDGEQPLIVTPISYANAIEDGVVQAGEVAAGAVIEADECEAAT